MRIMLKEVKLLWHKAGVSIKPRGLVFGAEKGSPETSLVVQWLRIHAPKARGPVSIPGQGTRSLMPQRSVHMPQLKIFMLQ